MRAPRFVRSSRFALVATLVSAGALPQLVACDDDPAPSEPPADGGTTDAPSGAAVPYARLSETGLYADVATKTVAPRLREYAPAYPLWTDGLAKRRWLDLPDGTTIDTSDPDHFVFPVGTKLFKEFSKDGKLLETRLIERRAATGRDEDDFVMVSFVWNEAQTDALPALEGAKAVLGTTHDVPSQTNCFACHLGERGRVLGFSVVQLAESKGPLTLATLVAEGKLSNPVPTGYVLPGDPTTKAALGVLHGNCGHCHNPSGIAWPDVQNVLRLGTAEPSAEGSALWKTNVGVPVERYAHDGVTHRIAPGSPEASAIHARMATRVFKEAMPPLGTNAVDPGGLGAVEAFVRSLPHDAGATDAGATDAASSDAAADSASSDGGRDAGRDGG